MAHAADRDFSATLDALWNFDAPAVSESRFRAELAKHSARSREARETTTQLARALGLLGIAAPADQRLRWNLAALAVADASTDARTRGWRASLLNNIGWSYHERGDYEIALDYWQKALAARDASGDAEKTRVAKWTVARGLRSLHRLDEAETIQRDLGAEFEKAGAPDGFVYEELAEIALARDDPAAAKQWAARAYSLLKNDIWLAANEKARLDRLARIGGVAPGSP